MREKLTPAKEKALAVLLTSKNVAEATRKLGCGQNLLYTYLADPAFAAEYKRRCTEYVDGATRMLQQSMTAAVERLQRIVNDDEETSGAQIQAARALLEYGLKFTEFTDLVQRMESAEAALAALENNK